MDEKREVIKKLLKRICDDEIDDVQVNGFYVHRVWGYGLIILEKEMYDEYGIEFEDVLEYFCWKDILLWNDRADEDEVIDVLMIILLGGYDE